MNKRERRPKDIGFYILVLVVLVAVIFLMTSNRETDALNMTYSQVRDLFRNNQVSSFVLEGDSLILTLKEPYGGRYNVVHQLFNFSVFYEDLHELIDEQ